MTITWARVFRLTLYILLLFGADAAVKAIVHYNIPLMLWSAPIYPYGGVPVFEDILGVDLSINHVTNRGGPWGVVASHHGALVLVRLFAIACLWGHLLFFNQIKFRQIPLVMIIAGAMGNVLDSFLYGHVIDMIHFVFWGYSFPVFNVADALICVGVGSLMLHACIQKWKLKKEKPLSLEEPAIEQSPFDRLGPYGHE